MIIIVKLVMFDIDDTLTKSDELDDKVFIEALHDVFDFKDVSTAWESYTHATHSCIFGEIYQSYRGRLPTPEEVNRFRRYYMKLLSKTASMCGGIQQIDGASEALSQLLASSKYAVAYAGGAWTASAIYKLHSAGLPTKDIPFAFADDDVSREGICSMALLRARAHYQFHFEKVIYIGDGVWDIRCALNLGYSFIGIGDGEGYKKLVAEGATDVLPNYQDIDLFFSMLQGRNRSK